MSSVSVTLSFRKKASGATNWSDVLEVTQMAGAVNGTATIDTGFQTLTPAPAQGDEYRVYVSGTWSNPGPPATGGDLTPIASASVTPVP